MGNLVRVVMVGVLLCLGGASVGCGDDAGVMGSSDAAPAPDDAGNIADEFNHFVFVIDPVVPLQDKLFEVEVTAYSSSDESVRLTGYEGVVTLTSSIGSLSPSAQSQVINNGRVTFSVSLDASAQDVVLTATDDDLPAITGSSTPFYLSPPGSTATALQVVINEVNWFGNDLSSTDEWVEIRNVSGGEINLSEWTLEAAGTTASPIMQFDNGTSLADGAYLVLARRQGADIDGERSALTGVSNVQIQTMELGNSGEALFLRDVAGTTIDQTPSGDWPAGDNPNDLSMERRDDLSGGGYSDGSQSAAWYTWSSLDTAQTSNAATSDQGTPGAANSDPDIFDHFAFVIEPMAPRIDIDFSVTITAYSSADDSVVASGYTGSVDLSTSAGGFTGQVSDQAMVAGEATLTVRSDLPGIDRTITVTDTIYPGITGISDTFEVLPEGDAATLREVVINEVNYFGNTSFSTDEWIELRNVSGVSLNLSGWIIESAGTGSAALTLPSGSIVADGDYLILADQQGPDIDTMRSSLTGVANVLVVSMNLLNGGEHLVLRDVNDILIDETPNPGWPAGSNVLDRSMERRDDLSGGGYTDGALDSAWYTWNLLDGTDTTSADTSDQGTPGAANTDPDVPALTLPYSTGFESGEPIFENLLTGGFSNVPPAGTAANAGVAIATTESITSGYTSRQLQSGHCIVLNNDANNVVASAQATASSDNGGNELRARIKLLWFTDDFCTTAHGTPSSVATSAVLTQGSYVSISITSAPPSGATHLKIRVELRDDNGDGDTGDDYAIDDVLVTQP